MGKTAVLGIDIGGTKTAWACYGLENGVISDDLLASGEQPTERGLKNLQKNIKNIIEHAEFLTSIYDYKVQAIGIGSPGRFTGDNTQIIAEGTATQLEETEGEFDGLNLKEAIEDSLDVKLPVFILNDAVAQLSGLLEEILKNDTHPEILGQTICYIGPGTGLGGGFAQVNEDKSFEIITDGHIQDIGWKLDKDDMQMAIDIYKQNNIEVRLFNGILQPQEILCGTAIKDLTRVGSTKDLNNPEEREKHKDVLSLIIRSMAILVKTINSGEFNKLLPNGAWPQEDLDAVKNTEIFIIGGGLGQSEIGKHIFDETKKLLDEESDNNFQFILTESKVATRAAASAVDLSS